MFGAYYFIIQKECIIKYHKMYTENCTHYQGMQIIKLIMSMLVSSSTKHLLEYKKGNKNICWRKAWYALNAYCTVLYCKMYGNSSAFRDIIKRLVNHGVVLYTISTTLLCDCWYTVYCIQQIAFNIIGYLGVWENWENNNLFKQNTGVQDPIQ